MSDDPSSPRPAHATCGATVRPELDLPERRGPPTVLLIVIAALTAMTIILWPIMRAFARRLEGKGNVDSGIHAEIEQLHTRLAEMDSLQSRLLELEERVDFAERLLSQSHDAQKGMLRGESP